MVLSILALRGLAGFSGDKWVWLDHDADWIYPNGPTGHLHDVYFNQCVATILIMAKFIADCCFSDMMICGLPTILSPSGTLIRLQA